MTVGEPLGLISFRQQTTPTNIMFCPIYIHFAVDNKLAYPQMFLLFSFCYPSSPPPWVLLVLTLMVNNLLVTVGELDKIETLWTALSQTCHFNKRNFAANLTEQEHNFLFHLLDGNSSHQVYLVSTIVYHSNKQLGSKQQTTESNQHISLHNIYKNDWKILHLQQKCIQVNACPHPAHLNSIHTIQTSWRYDCTTQLDEFE